MIQTGGYECGTGFVGKLLMTEPKIPQKEAGINTENEDMTFYFLITCNHVVGDLISCEDSELGRVILHFERFKMKNMDDNLITLDKMHQENSFPLSNIAYQKKTLEEIRIKDSDADLFAIQIDFKLLKEMVNFIGENMIFEINNDAINIPPSLNVTIPQYPICADFNKLEVAKAQTTIKNEKEYYIVRKPDASKYYNSVIDLECCLGEILGSEGNQYKHNVPTNKGSSGSPVISITSGQVVAIHKGGGIAENYFIEKKSAGHFLEELDPNNHAIKSTLLCNLISKELKKDS